MPTRTEVAAQSQQQAAIAQAAAAAVATWWAQQDLGNPDAVADAIVPVLTGIVGVYGSATASLAADLYERLRDDAGAPGNFTASTADGVSQATIERAMKWVLTPLYETSYTTDDGQTVTYPSEPDKALDRLSAKVEKYVRQQGRDTIAENAERDPSDARWIRVPTGDETCAFCRILASRGAQDLIDRYGYLSEYSALFQADGKRYHQDCDCIAVPVWTPADYPEGYDPEKYANEYLNARGDAVSGDIHDIAAKMREQLGVK